MNNNEPAAEHYSINGFKYFSELAKEYFPDLAAAYYTCQTIDISPEMQLILYRHWGPPHIDLPTNV